MRAAVRRPLSAPLLAALVLVLASALAACGLGSTSAPLPGRTTAGGSAAPAGGGGAQSQAAVPTGLPYDVTGLLDPQGRKYFGVQIDGAPQSLAPVDTYASQVGKQPDMIGSYVAWGTSFDVAAARNTWSSGAVYEMAWEPYSTSAHDIAAGKSDSYITAFATAVRALNVPVVISFGHEMNGDWYPWGTQATSAADFVAAWRHIHDLFLGAGATNVIWLWNPNDIYPVPSVPLEPLYPGDAYVDWVGITGYFTPNGPGSFRTLFLPTMEQVRTFTKKPFIIAETSVESSSQAPTSVNSLFSGVESYPDVLGFVWFDYDKDGTDWRVESRAADLAVFKRDAANSMIGVNVHAASP